MEAISADDSRSGRETSEGRDQDNEGYTEIQALTVLQVNVRPKVHLASNCLEDETLLATGWQRELDLPVETTRAKQCGVEGICTVRGHDNLGNTMG